MRISAISDVHVKQPHDDADRLLCSFLDHPIVKESDYIVLLGDIFDLMCGPHAEYIRSYDHIFKKLDGLARTGKKVLYYEGNHDVHLGKLFKKIWPGGEVVPSQTPGTFDIDGKTYYFSHGDEHEVNNVAYQRYMKFIHTAPLTFVANHVMPYSLLNFIGMRASQKSRKKGSYRFNEDLERAKFRSGVMETTQGKFDFVLGGHSHVKEEYNLPGTRSVYINNGYALNSRSFISIHHHLVSFVPLV
jgi:UDP-2,3-diacylglucosamine hydrolase